MDYSLFNDAISRHEDRCGSCRVRRCQNTNKSGRPKGSSWKRRVSFCSADRGVCEKSTVSMFGVFAIKSLSADPNTAASEIFKPAKQSRRIFSPDVIFIDGTCSYSVQILKV